MQDPYGERVTGCLSRQQPGKPSLRHSLLRFLPARFRYVLPVIKTLLNLILKQPGIKPGRKGGRQLCQGKAMESAGKQADNE
jgi:hypothetical protein